MYHERQRRQQCALHALNNLLQRPAFDAAALNALSDRLGAARTWLLGNWDANLLAAALEQQGLEVRWHDARDAALSGVDLQQERGAAGQRPGEQPPGVDQQQSQQQSQQSQQQQRLTGVIVNVPGQGLLARLTGGCHWLAVKRVSGEWWNLDSRLPAPTSFVAAPCDAADGGAARLRAWLQAQLAAGAHVLLVYEQQQQQQQQSSSSSLAEQPAEQSAELCG
ncbi:josephin-like protein [Scenedesmus sp. PABB004]|nr:josephin-like protein [Scenedesmus sp. PABB004]